MDTVLVCIRTLTAIIAPLATIILVVFTSIQSNHHQGYLPNDAVQCLHCGKARDGGYGRFYYTEKNDNLTPSLARKHIMPPETPILGSGSHFVCDQCALRYIRAESIQSILMVLIYPAYLYILLPLVQGSGFSNNFFIETILVVLSLAGLTSAFDLNRRVRTGETPLSEARDNIAIKELRHELDNKYRYFTRSGSTKLKK